MAPLPPYEHPMTRAEEIGERVWHALCDEHTGSRRVAEQLALAQLAAEQQSDSQQTIRAWWLHPEDRARAERHGREYEQQQHTDDHDRRIGDLAVAAVLDRLSDRLRQDAERWERIADGFRESHQFTQEMVADAHRDGVGQGRVAVTYAWEQLLTGQRPEVVR